MNSNGTHPTERNGKIIRNCASQHKPNSFPVMDGDAPFNHFARSGDKVVRKETFVDRVILVRGGIPNANRVGGVSRSERREPGNILSHAGYSLSCCLWICLRQGDW